MRPRELTDVQYLQVCEQFGAALRECRDFAGIGQGEFGDGLGVTGSSVSHWERGRGLPRAKTLYKLCKWMGISVDYLFGCSRERATEQKTVRAKARASAAR